MTTEEEERSSVAESYVQPLLVRFNPPAFRQRHALVRDTLRSMQPRCSSLLDVGTGDGGLLTYLTNCNDEVPLSKLVGFDPDPEEIEEAALNTKPYSFHEENMRWRPLEISLYRGEIADIVTTAAGLFDCITTIEVLEHLDPPDVLALPQICLNQLQPRCWIVTTPNRDFNSVFDRIDDGQSQTFTRKGIDYPMRHDDHRFEMSREEFQDWAKGAAVLYGYDVHFTGVGNVQNAFEGQRGWRNVFPEVDLDTAFGFSTQAAIFSRTSSPSIVRDTFDPLFEDMMHVVTHNYPYDTNDMYPPTSQLTAQLVLAAETLFRPPFQAGKDYRGEDISVQIVDCKEFFETCYAMRRAARFDFDVFFDSVAPLLGQILVPSSPEITDLEPQMPELEPSAVLVSAEFVVVDDWRTCISYKYDISSFSSPNLHDEEGSMSTISGDWDLAKDTEFSEVACWTHVEEPRTFDDSGFTDWHCVEQDNMLTSCVADMAITS